VQWAFSLRANNPERLSREGEINLTGERAMPAITFSTATLPERDQFPFWAELASSSVIPIAFDRIPGSGPGFFGEMTVRRIGGATVVEVRSENIWSRRGREHIARTDADFHNFTLTRSAIRSTCSASGELVTTPGTGLMTAPEAVIEGHALSHHDFMGWFLPSERLIPHLPRRRSPVWQVKVQQGIGSLVTVYANTLASEVDRIEPDLAEAVIDNFCRLLALAAGASARDMEGGREAVRAARLERAKRYVERHLADPGLSPASAARDLGVSVRQLHLLFEPTGTSFARHVLARRLEEARATLAGPGATGRSVAEVAFAWGFDSLPTFYRAFRRAYGVAPGEMRPAKTARQD
jgi:AraC-like DNA-binding protein